MSATNTPPMLRQLLGLNVDETLINDACQKIQNKGYGSLFCKVFSGIINDVSI
jgi:hypothetical protein